MNTSVQFPTVPLARRRSVKNPPLPGKGGCMNSILECVGETPMALFSQLTSRKDIQIFGKLEMMNPGGSIKDRTAVALLRDGLKKGVINSNTMIVESSSGNLGLGLAQACARLQLKLKVVVDALTNPHTIRLIHLYGGSTDVVEMTDQDKSLLDARLRRVQEIVRTDESAYWVNQYQNEANPQAHNLTMREIVRQTQGNFDRVYIATSTCGTLVGCAEYLAESGLHPDVIGVDAVGSRIFQSKKAAAHHTRHIPGHGASRTSHFLKDHHADGVRLVSDIDCVEGCRLLVKKEGILAGGSSGGVVSALLRDEADLPSNSRVVLILCDRGERYLDTVYNDEWVKTTLGHTPSL